jgi:hypothetical protein
MDKARTRHETPGNRLIRGDAEWDTPGARRPFTTRCAFKQLSAANMSRSPRSNALWGDAENGLSSIDEWRNNADLT